MENNIQSTKNIVDMVSSFCNQLDELKIHTTRNSYLMNFMDLQIGQLYMALQCKKGILLVGEAGAGKSTAYSILAKALTSLFYGKETIKEEELKPERSLHYQYSQKLQVSSKYKYLHNL